MYFLVYAYICVINCKAVTLIIQVCDICKVTVGCVSMNWKSVLVLYIIGYLDVSDGKQWFRSLVYGIIGDGAVRRLGKGGS